MSNPNREGNLGFQSLLYVNFIIKKKYRVDEIAVKMRIATDTLYRYIRGENIIPPDRINDLINATGDSEYVDFFCEPNGFIPVPAIAGKISKRSMRVKEINLSILNGKALEVIEEAFKDGKIDSNEFRKTHKLLSSIRKSAAEIDEIMKKEARL